MRLPIYLDYSATTPVDPLVAKKMMHYLTPDGIFGNPASRFHSYGWQAEEAVEIARHNIAALIGADARDIVFTSGATESNNLALKGVAHANSWKGRHIITSVTEHKAVLDPCKHLEHEGFRITKLVPKSNGLLSTQQLSEAIRADTIMVSIMHVNNEIGVIQDITAFGELCSRHDVLFHVDVTQSVGKLPIDIKTLPVDLMSFSSHKLYGPKGIGGLYVRRHQPPISIETQIHGGGHERGMRSGTLPVHQIVGMGEAYRLAAEKMAKEMPTFLMLRDRLLHGLEQIDGANMMVNGDLQHSIATLLNVSFRNIDGEALILSLKNLAISSGSACTAASFQSSYVLRALGVSDELAHSSLRFSIGRFTTSEEIDYAILQLKKAIKQLRT